MKLIHAGERAEGVFAKEEAYPLTGEATNAILRQSQPARAPYRLSLESVLFGNAQELGGLLMICARISLACCFVAPDDAAGLRTRTVALPVSLGPDGLAEIVVPPLNIAERVALDNAMML